MSTWDYIKAFIKFRIAFIQWYLAYNSLEDDEAVTALKCKADKAEGAWEVAQLNRRMSLYI